MPPTKSQAWRLIFVLHLYALIAVLSVTLTLGGAGLAAWKIPAARRWVHSEVVRLYLRKVAPKLPFEIQDIDVEAKWSNFIRGKLGRIRLELLWSGWKIELSGPIDIFYDHKEPETHINAVYEALVDATPPGKRAKPLPELPLRIAFRAGDRFSHLDTLSITTNIADLRLPRFGVRAQGLSVDAGWDNGNSGFKLAAQVFSLSNAAGPELGATDLAVSASGPLKLKPFKPGPDVRVNASVSRARTSIDGTSLDIPLAKFPVHAVLSLQDGAAGFDIAAGAPQEPELALRGTVTDSPAELNLSWKTPRIPLREAVAAARTLRSDLPLLDSLKWLRKLSGTLQTSGRARLGLPFSEKTFGDADVEADLRVEKLRFEWPGRSLALSGANLDLPVSTRRGVNGTLSIDRILFRRLVGRLAPTRIEIQPLDPSRRKLHLHVGDSRSAVPLQIAGVPIRIGGLDGTVDLGTDYDLASSLELPPTDAAALAHSLCLEIGRLPPARVSIELPHIDLEPGTITTDSGTGGKIEAKLFDGALDLTNLAFYNLDTAVPESDFDVDMNGVRLDEVGAWSGFGEMDGILRAYAHDVVMQSWLPTQYDFSFQAIPYSRPKVVFSPEAMRNLARLISSDAIDRLPGVVQWLAFGWPHRMFGGYDVYFFGVSLFSKNGSILFSALDPPDFPPTLPDEEKKTLLWKQQRNHYILYGQWFKIPLNAARYPAIVSARQVSDYVHELLERFQAVAKAAGSVKEAKEILWHEEHEVDCAPPSL